MVKTMKFAVGYQLAEEDEEPFVDIVKDFKEHIAEVYFPWLDMPSGRASLTGRRGYVDWTGQQRLINELSQFKEMGIKADILFNASCYGGRAVSQYLANKVCSVLEYLEKTIGRIEIVTTTSLSIAYTVKKYFPDIDVRASVNMRIGTVKGMQYISHLFDSFYIQREYNRDFSRIREMKSWTDVHHKSLYLLANSGCMNFCSGQTFHDNLVAHEDEIDEMDNIKAWSPHMCWNYLKDGRNWVSVLQNSWVRPEDLHHYEKFFSVVKLATRMHTNPRMVIQAYVNRKYCGNLLDLFEPGYGPAFAPYIVDNTAFPSNWFQQTSECSKDCYNCTYCEEVLKKVLKKMGHAYRR